MPDSKGLGRPIPSNADEANPTSVLIADAIATAIKDVPTLPKRLQPQTAGDNFEKHVRLFIEETFRLAWYIRPGSWAVKKVERRDRLALANNEQYAHLKTIHRFAQDSPELAAALGSDYLVSSDVIVTRTTLSDEEINRVSNESGALPLVDDNVAVRSRLRTVKIARQEPKPRELLHATISCKWTIRSDRSQNTRLEAQNLSRNRKGNQPHIVVVTGEPLPSRLASVALSTGDIDCVYHFALPELLVAVATRKQEYQERAGQARIKLEPIKCNEELVDSLRSEKTSLAGKRDNPAKTRRVELDSKIKSLLAEKKSLVAQLAPAAKSYREAFRQLEKLKGEEAELAKIVNGNRLKDISDLPLDLAV